MKKEIIPVSEKTLNQTSFIYACLGSGTKIQDDTVFIMNSKGHYHKIIKRKDIIEYIREDFKKRDKLIVIRKTAQNLRP